jgi:hypothetical protein
MRIFSSTTTDNKKENFQKFGNDLTGINGLVVNININRQQHVP